MPEKIAFITYETPFAPAGGVAAVVGRLPMEVEKASGRPTIVLTPFHHKIPKTATLGGEVASLGQVSIPFGRTSIEVKLLKLQRDISWCFLQPDDRRFFAGLRHPYDVPAADLLRDALFFGAAAAQALPLLDSQARWTLMMQDWEAATVALALAPRLRARDENLRAFLTLHNSYDSGVSDAALLRFGIEAAHCRGDTVLQRALPLVEEPVFTVSDQFALDFSEEIFQAEVMTPHLQTILPPRLVGIPNGLFADLAAPADALAQASRGDFAALRTWKTNQRAEALQALDAFQPTEDKPVWGDLRQFDRQPAVWFVLAGRDDARQKGYDVACSAIEAFLTTGGAARFLFFPIPGDEGLAGLAFLKRLAQRFPHSVLALPFIFREGYFAALQGADYGIMPSLYEPFGMANEFYLNGTVGIGRATGGILQQIVPLRSAAAFSRAVQRRAARYFSDSAQPTGIVYRERDGIPSAAADWRNLNAADYETGDRLPDRVQQRQMYPLFRAMSAELLTAIQDGVRVRVEHPDLYWQMLTEGIGYIQNRFTWERAAQSYARYFE